MIQTTRTHSLIVKGLVDPWPFSVTFLNMQRNRFKRWLQLWCRELPLSYCHLSLFGWKAVATLTHWDRLTHICVSKLTIIVSDNGLSPGRRQTIIWTNTGILLIRSTGTNFNDSLIDINRLSFKKIHFKMSSGKYRPSCFGLNALGEDGYSSMQCKGPMRGLCGVLMNP